MKIHPRLEETQTKEFKDSLLKLAKEMKLNKINFEIRYDVVKAKAKNKNRYMPDSGLIISRGNPCLIGNTEAVALYFSNTDEWSQTSAIIKCTKYKTFIKIETLNSVYKLYPWE